MSLLGDYKLILLAQSGNKAAFQSLISDYYPYVSRFLLKLTGNEHAAEDLTQETFLRVVRSIDRYDVYGKASFSTYVMTIAKRLYIDDLRKKKIVPVDISDLDVDSGQDVERFVLKGLQIDEALKQLENLPPDQAVAIKMKYLEQKTLDEIAQRLHTQPKTVKSRIHNGMVKLRLAFTGGNE